MFLSVCHEKYKNFLGGEVKFCEFQRSIFLGDSHDLYHHIHIINIMSTT
ncbi:MAG: hypothetical protein AAFO15_01395 [Pseudomonadota bacterium]